MICGTHVLAVLHPSTPPGPAMMICCTDAPAPDSLITGAVAKSSADFLLRSVSKSMSMSKRSSSASELAALDTAPAAAAPDAAAEDGGEVDPMHSKMLSLVLSGVLSACTNGIHDAAAQELPGLFGAPQVLVAFIAGL